MTTPSTFGTPYQIIRDAMVEAGYLGRGRDPNSDHLAIYMNKLSYIFNFLQTQGLKLWLNQDISITPIQGQNLYTLGPTGNVIMTKPIRAVEGYYTDLNNVRRPVMQIARQAEWDALSTIQSQGPLTSFYIDKQQLSLNVYMWLTPDAQTATGTFHLIITQQVTTPVTLIDTMNFPVEWYLCLMWQLAAQICTGQPQSIVDRCTQQSAFYTEKLEDWDVEDASTRFVVDSQVFNTMGRFR